jgi:hypothetical protein
MQSFSSNFTEKKNARANVPVNLLELWLEGGQNILYLSDRDISVGTIAYAGQILDWGVWGKEKNRLVMANAGAPPLANIFRQTPPEGALIKLYQWFEGLTAQEQALLWVGKVVGPVTIKEEKIELVLESQEKGLHKIFGRRLTSGDYPYCPAENLGKLEPIVWGQVGPSPTWLIDAGGSSPLSKDVSSDDAVMALEDTSSFPSAGYILLEEELISYGAKTARSLTGCQRGLAGTIGKSHRGGTWAYEYDAPQVYVAAGHPSLAVDAVYQEDKKLPAQAYTINLANSTLVPGRLLTTITLNKPLASSPPIGYKSLGVWPDAVGTGNTAQNPEYCFDQDVGNVSVLKTNGRLLVLKRQGTVAHLGAINRITLEVRHFSKLQWGANERVALYAGSGSSWDFVGYLSRPAAEDLTQEGSHEHQASTRVALIKPNNILYQTGMGTNILPNVYDDNFAEGCVLYGNQSFKVNRATSVTNASGQITKVWACFNYYQVGSSNTMKLGVNHPNGASNWFYASAVSPGQASRTEKRDITLGRNWQWSDFVADKAYFWGEGNGGGAGNAYVMELWWEVEYIPSSGLKGAQGVSSPTKKIRDIFDITPLWASQNQELEGWDWLTGRQIKLELQNVGGQTEVYIPTVNWEITYAPKAQRLPVLYADIRGYADDAQGTYSGTPGALIENPADVFKLILGHQDFLNLPLSQYLDQNCFAKTRINFANRSYRFGGTILKLVNSEDLLEKLAFNCRSWFFFGPQGKAKLVFKV